MNSATNLVQEYRPTRRERILRGIFPSRYCWGPEPEWEDLDQVRVATVTLLDWKDRLRILVAGCIYFEARTATEHQVGRTETHVGVFPTCKTLEPAKRLLHHGNKQVDK